MSASHEPDLHLVQVTNYQPSYFRRRLKKPQTVHVLKEESGRPWMSDCPQERVYMGSVLPRVKPGMKVLTAGLGLGIFAGMALDRGAEVTVVERSAAVLAAVKLEHAKLTVVHADVKQWMLDADVAGCQFDFCYLDIWAGGSEAEMLDRYECLELASRISKASVAWQLWSIERGLLAECRSIDELLADREKNIDRATASLHASHGGFLLAGLYTSSYSIGRWQTARQFLAWLRLNWLEAGRVMMRLFAVANAAATAKWESMSEEEKQAALLASYERYVEKSREEKSSHAV